MVKPDLFAEGDFSQVAAIATEAMRLAREACA